MRLYCYLIVWKFRKMKNNFFGIFKELFKFVSEDEIIKFFFECLLIGEVIDYEEVMDELDVDENIIDDMFGDVKDIFNDVEEKIEEQEKEVVEVKGDIVFGMVFVVDILEEDEFNVELVIVVFEGVCYLIYFFVYNCMVSCSDLKVIKWIICQLFMKNSWSMEEQVLLEQFWGYIEKYE